MTEELFICNAKKDIKNRIHKKEYDKALREISVLASIMYEHNQFYYDDELEQLLTDIGENLFSQRRVPFTKREKNEVLNGKRVVIFYDSYGLDIRGVAIIYARTIARMGYQLVYLTHDSPENEFREMHHAVDQYGVIWEYYPRKNDVITNINKMMDVFDKYKPDSAFFYTTPWDVAGFLTFYHYAGVVDRYLINLTDHAFWLGKKCIDYFVSCRAEGCRINCNLRNIDKNKILRNSDDPPYIDFAAEFEGYPDLIKDRPFIFSGGSLYKTQGDERSLYYYMLDKILENNPQVCFWYAGGGGDSSKLDSMIQKYPERVVHTGERKDFIQIIKRCVLYLNTYPFLGGLMTRYPIAVGKIPLTLVHGDDSKGMTINQEKIGIEYHDPDELIKDVNKLLTDEEYRISREAMLIDGVASETEFESNVKLMIEEYRTNLTADISPIDTRKFREEYDDRFNFKKSLFQAITSNRAFYLLKQIPLNMRMGYFRFIFLKFKRRLEGD